LLLAGIHARALVIVLPRRAYFSSMRYRCVRVLR
jgi:hypothetical protein